MPRASRNFPPLTSVAKREGKSWFNIARNSASAASIDIFDEIGYFGVTAKDFIAQLRALGNVSQLTLNIDCPGGDCNDGLTIYDAIKATNAEVTANITGLAASMASVIMLAAKTINIAENGRVMIHRVTGGAYGNADDLQAATDVTKQFEARIVALYMQRTGETEAKVRDMMKAELGTWFFGQEAVDAGFADALMTGTKAKAFNTNWAHLFTVLPAALFDSGEQVTSRITAPSTMTTDQKNRFRALLALAQRTAEEETEFKNLQTLATKEGYDPESDPVELKARIASLEKHIADKAAAKAARKAEEKAQADAETKAKLDAEAAENNPAALKARIAKLEALITSGIHGSAGGRSPVQNTGAAEPQTMKRADFNKLTARAQADFIKTPGNKLID